MVLAAAGVVMALSLVAGIPAVGRLGTLIYKRDDVYLAILIGSLIAGVVWLLPYVGFLVPLIVLPLGLGGWMLSWRTEEVEEPATQT